ncbi:MAG: FAD:protein FMN transferase [Planctomycetota bacterium]|jgi:thiamine biosynthesis lipoprotein
MSGNRRLSFAAAAVLLCIAALAALRHCGASEAPSEAAPKVETTFTALGTFVTIRAAAPDEDAAREAVEGATELIKSLEKRLSRFDDDSDISAINRAAAGESVSVSDETLEVLLEAAEISEATGGAFDVTVAPLVELWKAAGKAGKLPDEKALQEALSKVSYEYLEIAREARTVTKLHDGVSVDLGAIAKGYIAERCAAFLRAGGVKSGLVDAGGDGVFIGGVDERPWRIGVLDPRNPLEIADAVFLRHAAAVTSGNYARFSTIEGRRYSHIIDPRSGRPAEGPDSVTVIAKDGATADGWATALSVMGEEGAAAARAAGVEFMMLFVKEDGLTRVESQGFARYRKE